MRVANKKGTMILSTFLFAMLFRPASAFVPKASTQSFLAAKKHTHGLPFVSDLDRSTARARGSNLQLQVVGDDRLMTYFLEKCIETAVPTAGVLVVLLFAAKAFSSNKGGKFPPREPSEYEELYDDLYGSPEMNDNMQGFNSFLDKLNGKRGKKTMNKGYPETEYIKVTNMNDQFQSYKFSVEKATKGKYSAVTNYRNGQFQRSFSPLLGNNTLSDATIKYLYEAEENLLKEATPLVSAVETINGQLRAMAMDELVVDDWNVDNSTNPFDSMPWVNRKEKKAKAMLSKELTMKTSLLAKLEADFYTQCLTAIVEGVDDERDAERTLSLYKNLFGSMDSLSPTRLPGSLSLYHNMTRPLQRLLDSAPSSGNVYVLNFNGDVTASQVEFLREEITAVLEASEGIEDEVVLVLQTGGGTVTGYGLAAAQLQRIKSAGLKLTICVEQVAASGGYMMACCADKIVASPFAVLGSIGVISEQPNAYERLKQEGISFQTVTAGKYKRTLTPFKKPTREDIEKASEDIEAVLYLFKDYVKTNRPILDIDNVATGETWFGEDAFQKALCDRLATKDEVLSEYVGNGYNVLGVEYVGEDQASALKGLLPVGELSSSKNGRGVLRTLVRFLVDEVKSELSGGVVNNDFEMKRIKAQKPNNDIFLM